MGRGQGIELDSKYQLTSRTYGLKDWYPQQKLGAQLYRTVFATLYLYTAQLIHTVRTLVYFLVLIYHN